MFQLFTVPDIIGYSGFITVVVLYYLSLTGRINTRGLRYPMINLVGCVLIMVSLVYSFNPASLAIEIFWSTISLIGIVRYFLRKSLA